MRYVSLFSGIEAATVAWEPLGWEPVAFAEIEPFPCAVLAYRWPDVPNLGDVCQVDWKEFVKTNGAIDVVVGGSPCQSFSIAGGRESLDGESYLCFEYWRCICDVRPRWFLWENVPGVFSTRDNAFGQFLEKLEQLGYSLAWRTLDAQFFGVAQRRRRVFLVGYLGDGGASAAVLFNAESVRGNTQTSREKREALTRAVDPCADRGFPVICIADDNARAAVDSDMCGTLKVGGATPLIAQAKTLIEPERYIVRRLTVTECERLQGFPDGHTDIPYRGKPHLAAGPRSKALGNSMAVPVIAWIGKRIELCDELIMEGKVVQQ